MKRGIVVIALAIGLGFLFGAIVHGRIYIDIDSPQFQKTPIAIGGLRALSTSLPDEFGPAVTDHLSRLLNITGYFSLISPQAFLEKPGEKIDFTNWSAIGAEYLVVGSYVQAQARYAVELRLYDVPKGEIIAQHRYQANMAKRLELARSMAHDILKALSGEGGIFYTRLAFVARKGPVSEIGTVNFDGSDLREVTKMNNLTLSPRWSPDGNYLAFMSYRNRSPQLFIHDLRSGTSKVLSALPGLNLPGAWSPDGRFILATLSVDGNEEIYTIDVLTGKRTRLTYHPDIDVSPVWSPDGKTIAFVSDRSGSPQIFLMNSDGSNVRRLTFTGNYNTSPAWSPRGDRILYEGRKEGKFQIFSLAVGGGEPVQITNGAEHRSPTWSPDGRFIACSVQEGAKEWIKVMNANGSNVRLLVSGSQPAWSPVMAK